MPPLTKANTDIAQAADNATKSIAQAAESATKVIAQAAESAAKVLANAASEALKVTNVKNADDHDLLIKISTQMERLNVDINEIKTGTSGKIDNHEKRLLCLEGFKSEHDGGNSEKKYTVEWIFAALMLIATAANIYFSHPIK